MDLSFINLQFITLCLAITALTTVAKSVFNHFIKDKEELRDVILPLTNLGLSLLVCLIFHFAYLSGIIASLLSNVIYKLVLKKLTSL